MRLLMGVFVTLGIGNLLHAAEPSEEELKRLDELHITIQRICPVSGNLLGEHGDPIKVNVGKSKEEVFLCCKACATQKLDPEHWTTIHLNLVESQRICPVMKKPLPKTPRWTIVDGRVIYVCCPPCIDKIEREPQNVLTAVNKLYSESLAKRDGSK